VRRQTETPAKFEDVKTMNDIDDRRLEI